MTTDLRALLHRAADLAATYREALPGDTPVHPGAKLPDLVAALGGQLPQQPTDPAEVIELLADAAGPALVGTEGPRFLGFVMGGSLDAALAADVLTSGWGQVAFNAVTSPAAAAVEQVAGGWVLDLLGLPAGATVGFTTGGQGANNVCLAAARNHVLAGAGWNVEADGLAGAPRVRVVAGEERHATVDRGLRLLGFGSAVVEPVAADANGAMDPADLARVLAAGPAGAPTILCAQAGNVNTGACDPMHAVCDAAAEHGAWVHLDGAFGLWAAAAPATAALVAGAERADSWAVDAHKWLNVPYDTGLAICAHPDAHRAAMGFTAAYLTGHGEAGTPPAPSDLVPESSRRARGFPVWAALRQLGRSGVADLVQRCCSHARRFAEGLQAGGVTISNDVVLNVVLADLGGDEPAERTVVAVQQDGTCWLGATTWQGRRLLRAAFSNATTTEADVDRCVDAVLRARG